jgi:Holliday junction resolvase
MLENPQQSPGYVLERLQIGISILLAAIIRDFWVVEERQRVFGVAAKTKKAARLRSDWGKKSVVYIPRIRYVGDIQNRADELNYVIRRPHFVIGHLRKALQASERQIVLAKQYGIVVPEGFTFVRPHRRGDKAQETIYRSRSALQCIRALKPEHMETGSDAWFTYELNVKNWLSSYGYEVEHMAANRHGDGGVDIQAYKEGEHLLVQCKYWQTEKIGPKVIREMLGTLQTFPKGARGVIVTSTELTEGARIKAIDNGIQFIENADFSAELTRKV